MTPQHLLLDTPAVVVSRLKSSIEQVNEHRSELIALGLDHTRHQPTPLQNKLLAAACAAMEAWVEIQMVKLEKAEARANRVPPEAEPIKRLPEGAQVISLGADKKPIPLYPMDDSPVVVPTTTLIPNPNPGVFGPYFIPGQVPKPSCEAPASSPDFPRCP